MNRKYKRFITLLLAFAIVASVTSATVIAKAVDLSRSCSLYVDLNGKNQYPDLREIELQADLYKVAPAVSVEGYDAYTYGEPERDFSSLDLKNVKSQSDWADLAQEATKLTIDNNLMPDCTGETYRKINDLDPGLYLVIVHGVGMPPNEYVREITDEEGNVRLSGSASSSVSSYLFNPEFVTLPGKPADLDSTIQTSRPSEWVYDVSIYIKTEPADRFTSLEIVNSLDAYTDGSPALAIYDVEATMNGNIIYSDVVEVIVDDDSCINSVILDDIPVGSIVTVTEVYSGGCYSLVSEATQSTTAERGQVSTVTFTNTPNDKAISTGGITNRFAYDGEKWNWIKIPHNL